MKDIEGLTILGPLIWGTLGIATDSGKGSLIDRVVFFSRRNSNLVESRVVLSCTGIDSIGSCIEKSF